MIDLSDKTILINDAGGDYCHIAEALVGQFGRILYHVPWESAFSTSKGLLAGIGLDGIEKVPDFFEALPNADIVMFCDVGNYGLTEYLRSQGIPVFGSGMGGKLETDRAYLKKVCADLGIDAADHAPVQGTDTLRAILEKNEDLWIKLSYLRGEAETRHHKNWMESEDWLNGLSVRMGPYKHLAQFIIEMPIADDDGPCVEIGFDSFCSDGIFPDETLFGYEAKDCGYIGCVGRLPPRLEQTREKLAPILREVGYRGALSTETREVESGSYLVDLTCRWPSPPSELESKLIENLGEVIWQVAHGETSTPIYRFRYGAQLVLRSQEFEEHHVALKIGRPDRSCIHGHCVVKGQHYAVSVSEIPEMGGVVGMGDSMEDAVAEACEVAETVEGADIKFDASALTKIIDTIRDGEQLDIPWGETTYGQESR